MSSLLGGLGSYLGTNSNFQAQQAPNANAFYGGPGQSQLGNYLANQQGIQNNAVANLNGQNAAQQQNYLQQLQSFGSNTSAAQGLLAQGTANANAGAMSAAKSVGTQNPAVQAANLRAASGQAATNTTNAGAQAAQLQAQQQQAALGMTGSALQNQAQNQLGLANLGGQGAQGYVNAQLNAANQATGAQESNNAINSQNFNAAQGINAQTAAQNAQSNGSMLSGLAGAASGALMMSDIRAKQDVAPAGDPNAPPPGAGFGAALGGFSAGYNGKSYNPRAMLNAKPGARPASPQGAPEGWEPQNIRDVINGPPGGDAVSGPIYDDGASPAPEPGAPSGGPYRPSFDQVMGGNMGAQAFEARPSMAQITPYGAGPGEAGGPGLGGFALNTPGGPSAQELASARNIVSDKRAKQDAFQEGRATVLDDLMRNGVSSVSYEDAGGHLARPVQLGGQGEKSALVNLAGDILAKRGVPSVMNEADAFLSHLNPHTYRYKDPAMEPSSEPNGGRYLGVMAQDVERTPGIGSQIVKDTPHGKVLEGNALMSAMAGGLGRLHQRVHQLEVKPNFEPSYTRARGFDPRLEEEMLNARMGQRG